MKPRTKLAETSTPDGGTMCLYRHDRDFFITVNGEELMTSRMHESELELARLGCAHLAGRQAPSVLIGGLGLGYTLKQTLEMVGDGAQVTVIELMSEVLEWNSEFLTELQGDMLQDQRVVLKRGHVLKTIESGKKFDAILLDVDNGPTAITDKRNRRLYGRHGIEACRLALREKGCLAVWSAEPSKSFERLMMGCGFKVSRFRVPSYPGSKSKNRFVFVASEDKESLPPGGGELYKTKGRK